MYDVLPQVLWTKQFLEEQGWLDSKTVLYQDNTSSILLEKNGWSSSTKRTKHMHIWYFYVTEQVRKKTIHVTHCLTDEIVADFFIIPLQGSLFTKIHKYIMGNEEPAYQVLPRSVLSSHNLISTWKQNSIGTWKHNSEAVEEMEREQRNAGSDGQRKGHFLVNVQDMTLQTTGGADECMEQSDAEGVQCGNGCGIVEP